MLGVNLERGFEPRTSSCVDFEMSWGPETQVRGISGMHRKSRIPQFFCRHENWDRSIQVELHHDTAH